MSSIGSEGTWVFDKRKSSTSMKLSGVLYASFYEGRIYSNESLCHGQLSTDFQNDTAINIGHSLSHMRHTEYGVVSDPLTPMNQTNRYIQRSNSCGTTKPPKTNVLNTVSPFKLACKAFTLKWYGKYHHLMGYILPHMKRTGQPLTEQRNGQIKNCERRIRPWRLAFVIQK